MTSPAKDNVGSKRKNDQVDAQKLAKLLLLDMVPPVHVPSIDVRAWRSLIVLRQRVLQQVVRAKNQVRGVLRENDIAGAKWLWSKKQLAWLESLELHAALGHITRDGHPSCAS